MAPDKRFASVLFVAGEPAKAHVSEPVSHFGQVLVELGFMTAEVLDRTLAELDEARGADERPLCGEFLLEKALVDAVGVEAAFREQMIRRLRHVATMPPDATYAYYDGFDALRGIGGGSAQASTRCRCSGPCFARARRRPMSTRRSRGWPGRPSGSRRPPTSRASAWGPRSAAIELLRIRRLTVAEFSSVSGLAEHDVRLLTYLLLVTKQVDLISASRSSIPPRPELDAADALWPLQRSRPPPTTPAAFARSATSPPLLSPGDSRRAIRRPA